MKNSLFFGKKLIYVESLDQERLADIKTSIYNMGYSGIRILRKDISQVWLDLNLALIGETLSDNMEIINGISINPKNCVVKIWVSKCPEENEECPINNDISNLDTTKSIFMVNLEKSKNSNKQKTPDPEYEKTKLKNTKGKIYKNKKKYVQEVDKED